MIVSIKRIGNSKGIILPKSLLESAKITEQVELNLVNETIIITAVKQNPREGWKEQMEAAINSGQLPEETPVLGDFSNDFDKEEWTW